MKRRSKKHLFLWLRNRTTENRKGKKAQNIKGKWQSKNFSTDSKQPAVHHSSQRDNQKYNFNLPLFGRFFIVSEYICYLNFKYSINLFTASEAVFLSFIAIPISRCAGTSSSFIIILYGTLFSISSGKMLTPNPLSIIDIIA